MSHNGKFKKQLEQVKAATRDKVDHPPRMIKCQFGGSKARYQVLAKNTCQLRVMVALSNLLMVRKQLIGIPQA